jgi:hypothetical protein
LHGKQFFYDFSHFFLGFFFLEQPSVPVKAVEDSIQGASNA